MRVAPVGETVAKWLAGEWGERREEKRDGDVLGVTELPSEKWRPF